MRTGTTLQAIASGDAPPPQLEVARTPRTGIAVTHRVIALFNLVAAPASPPSPRALAEPRSMRGPHGCSGLSRSSLRRRAGRCQGA
jgi:hypothetical protein